MSRPKPASENSVSLFPFLAVLVCAMGALIFLLLITTRQIRQEAYVRIQEARQEQASKRTAPQAADEPPVIAPIPSHFAPQSVARVRPVELPPKPRAQRPLVVLPPEPEPIDPNIALREQVQELAAAAQSRKQELSKKEQQLAALQAELKKSEAARHELLGGLKSARDKQQELAELGQSLVEEARLISDQILQTGQKLRRVRQQSATESTKFAVIPYDGTNGTVRRPILIECTEQGLRFMQEDILLTAAELDGFTVPYNPLLAGARALVKHHVQKSLQQSGENPPPYVLMIVRPGGAIAYYVAKQLLKDLDQPHGYELLDESVEIDLSHADPEATAKCRQAIESTLAERDRVVAAVSAGVRSVGQPVRLKGGAGGLEIIEAERSPFDGAGRTSFDGPRGSSTRGPMPLSGEGTGVGDRSGAGRGDADALAGRSSAGTHQWGQPGAPAGSANVSESDNSSGSGFSAGLTRSAGAGPGSMGRTIGDAGSGGEPTLEALSSSVLGSSSPRDDLSQPGGTGGFSSTGPRIIEFPSQSRGNGGSAELGADPAKAASPASSGDSFTEAGGSRPMGRPQSGPFDATGKPISSAVSGETHPDEFDPAGAAVAAGVNPTPPGDGPHGGGSATSGPPSSSSASSRNGQSRRSSGTGGPSGSSGAASGGPQSPFLEFGADRYESGATNGRPNQRAWGVSPPRAGIGFERRTTVRIHADRIEVGSQPPIPIGRGETVEQLSDEVVAALDQHARTWGKPPENFYWIPSLKFVVAPGGNQYYERLHPAFRRLGVSSTVEYHLETSAAPVPR